MDSQRPLPDDPELGVEPDHDHDEGHHHHDHAYDEEHGRFARRVAWGLAAAWVAGAIAVILLFFVVPAFEAGRAGGGEAPSAGWAMAVRASDLVVSAAPAFFMALVIGAMAIPAAAATATVMSGRKPPH